ncbi:NYN domain-containing protein [Carboxydocella sp. ULO1]|uniref:NYN domain-containing protein n=1 Tax=Carboxydocella sp. ULO1 TaxID=1926599 RepID=UPI0009CF4CB4|nr:NYN domain-containing protein [Carboxydocella sp. ULO1]GAW28158.1 hypothetical protein ULO1_07280 [Carboxydocella sp. ULO1]
MQKAEGNELAIKDSGAREGEDKTKMAIDTFGRIMAESFQIYEKMKKTQNVGIFVDYDNVYWTLMKKYSHDPDHAEPDKNLFIRLWDTYGRDNVRTFRVYGDFQAIRTCLTSLQKKRVQIRHVYSNGKVDERRKNSSDIELCIDAIESTYKDSNISLYVFVTADSDMIPILSRMIYKGKTVHLYYLSSAAPKHVNITDYAHFSMDLMEFINIEQKEYIIDDYIIDALKFIDNWHKQHGNTSKWLGKTWLLNGLEKQLQIPQDTCSKILDKLKKEELIDYTTKETEDENEMKSHVIITSKGKQKLEQGCA